MTINLVDTCYEYIKNLENLVVRAADITIPSEDEDDYETIDEYMQAFSDYHCQLEELHQEMVWLEDMRQSLLRQINGDQNEQ